MCPVDLDTSKGKEDGKVKWPPAFKEAPTCWDVLGHARTCPGVLAWACAGMPGRARACRSVHWSGARGGGPWALDSLLDAYSLRHSNFTHYACMQAASLQNYFYSTTPLDGPLVCYIHMPAWQQPAGTHPQRLALGRQQRSICSRAAASQAPAGSAAKQLCLLLACRHV